MNSKNDWALENRIINIEAVATIASALGDLKENMVFVGGAVVSLYTDDHAADEICPTQDIDMEDIIYVIDNRNENDISRK